MKFENCCRKNARRTSYWLWKFCACGEKIFRFKSRKIRRKRDKNFVLLCSLSLTHSRSITSSSSSPSSPPLLSSTVSHISCWTVVCEKIVREKKVNDDIKKCNNGCFVAQWLKKTWRRMMPFCATNNSSRVRVFVQEKAQNITAASNHCSIISRNNTFI